MKEKLLAFAENIHNDSMENNDKVISLSQKLNYDNSKYTKKKIKLEIMKYTNNKSLCDFQLDILNLYFHGLMFYSYLIRDDLSMEIIKKKIDEKIKSIKNDIANGKYLLYFNEEECIKEFNKALSQIENIMYLPDCKINNYEYLTYLSEIETFINDLKNNTLNNISNNKQVLK